LQALQRSTIPTIALTNPTQRRTIPEVIVAEEIGV